MTARVLRSLAFGASLLAAGSAIGWWVRDVGSTTHTRAAASIEPSTRSDTRRQAEHVSSVSIQAVDTSAIKDAVRQVVNEELALARAEASAETAAESAEPEPSPEIHATLASGRQYIEQAIQAGRWGPEQAEHVHSLGAGLTGEQFHALVQPLSSAINAGRLRVDVEGPPF